MHSAGYADLAESAGCLGCEGGDENSGCCAQVPPRVIVRACRLERASREMRRTREAVHTSPYFDARYAFRTVARCASSWVRNFVGPGGGAGGSGEAIGKLVANRNQLSGRVRLARKIFMG
jgi:hypothetical protein